MITVFTMNVTFEGGFYHNGDVRPHVNAVSEGPICPNAVEPFCNVATARTAHDNASAEASVPARRGTASPVIAA